MREYPAETVAANEPFADVFMPVHVRPERSLGIVRVNHSHVLEAQYALGIGGGFVQAYLSGHIETRRQKMAGVQAVADLQVRFSRRQLTDGTQLFELASHLRTAAGCVLEQNGDIRRAAVGGFCQSQRDGCN